VPHSSGSTGRTPETHLIDFRAAEQLLAARDPRGAVKLLDPVIAAHPENTAARLLRARAFFDLHDAGVQLGVFPKPGTAGQRALLMLRGFGLRNG